MSTPESTPKKHDDYKVAIVCAIGFEMKAARAMLDHKHPRLPSARGDPNLYVLGEIGGHNVVLACLSGSQGKGAAAIVATNMSRTFPSIEWRFLVGIGGGVPSAKHDIRLGDVVVSMPEGEYGGVVQYDLGKDTDDGFKLKGFLWPPPTILRNAVELMRIELSEEEMAEVLRDRCRLSKYERPASKHDVLFEEDYSHVAGGEECKNCDKTRVKTRPPRSFEGPEVHYGLIASGDRVMKSVRKAVAATGSIGDILCFEMEAAGIATEFPCLVIRGVSDYADSHKNDRWQLYAAAAAAAYTRELLSSYVPPEQPDDDETMGQSAQSPPLGRREPISQNMSGSGVQNAGTFSVGGDFNIGKS